MHNSYMKTKICSKKGTFILLVFVMNIVNIIAQDAQAENIFFKSSNTKPELKSYYIPPKQAVDVKEKIKSAIEEKSFVQEFDVEFGMLSVGGYCMIGSRALTVFIGRSSAKAKGKRICILDRKLGYIATKNQLTFKKGDIYHIKLIYNFDDLQAQCIVTDKKSSKLVWDSGKKLCSPITFKAIRYAVRGKRNKKSAPFAGIKWDEKKKKIIFCSVPYKNNFFICWMDNMQIKLTD